MTLNQVKSFEMRKKFLQFILKTVNKNVEINTFHGSDIFGLLRSIDYDIGTIHLSNFDTPVGKFSEGLVRGTDIIVIKIKF